MPSLEICTSSKALSPCALSNRLRDTLSRMGIVNRNPHFYKFNTCASSLRPPIPLGCFLQALSNLLYFYVAPSLIVLLPPHAQHDEAFTTFACCGDALRCTVSRLWCPSTSYPRSFHQPWLLLPARDYNYACWQRCRHPMLCAGWPGVFFAGWRHNN